MLVWWGSEVECVSAIARLERDGAIEAEGVESALARLKLLAASWHEVDASDALRASAVRVLRVHPLRAADALQLAAAFEACERRPASLDFVTLDDRLATAARREGFPVLSWSSVWPFHILMASPRRTFMSGGGPMSPWDSGMCTNGS